MKPARKPAPKKPIAKRPYSSPVLVEFGSVAQLTRGNTGSRVDTAGRTPTMPPPIIHH